MQLVYDSSTIQSSAHRIGAFRRLYENGFPDADEREDFHAILQRIAGKGGPHEPHTVLLLSLSEDTVTGGMVADWYAASRALHLTYLIVDPELRNQGTARKLIDTGIPRITDWIAGERKVKIKNVFLESNNPLIHCNKDNFNKAERLSIFTHLGAKRINIPYIQPALEEGKNQVDNLLLFSFTQFNETGDRIPAIDIHAFLVEFYAALGVPAGDPNLRNLQGCLDTIKDDHGFVELESLAESTAYSFKQASVTWHYIEEAPSEKGMQGVIGLPLPDTSPKCDHFFSFETDLLDYRNQKKPPFTTRFRKFITRAQLFFPPAYRYISEGAAHIKLAGRRRVTVNLSVSCSVIDTTRDTIYHITFAPAPEEGFSELDLIKLSEHFGSRQERYYGDGEIRISLNGQETGAVTIPEFLSSLDCCHPEMTYRNMGTGIIQLDFQQPPAVGLDLDLFFSLFRTSNRGELPESIRPFSKTLCGIILGIFDFNRMNDEEIFDTLIPTTVYDKSFMVSCRGSLLKICGGEGFMHEIPRNLIVSPYMLIPNMVLSYNEYILGKALRILDDALDPKKKRNTAFLEDKKIRVSDILGYDYLQDVFQYPSEKDIIELGNVQRGISNSYLSILKRTELLSEVIDKKRGNRSNRSGAILNALLVCLPAMQLMALLPGCLQTWIWTIVYLLVCLAVAVGIYNLTRENKNGQKMAKVWVSIRNWFGCE